MIECDRSCNDKALTGAGGFQVGRPTPASLCVGKPMRRQATTMGDRYLDLPGLASLYEKLENIIENLAFRNKEPNQELPQVVSSWLRTLKNEPSRHSRPVEFRFETTRPKDANFASFGRRTLQPALDFLCDRRGGIVRLVDSDGSFASGKARPDLAGLFSVASPTGRAHREACLACGQARQGLQL